MSSRLASFSVNSAPKFGVLQETSNRRRGSETSSAPTPRDPVPFAFEVAIVWSMPAIDGFDDFDLAPAKPKAHRHFEPKRAGAKLDLYLHGDPLPRR